MYNRINRLLYPRLLPLQTVLHFKYNKIWKSWVFFSLFVLKLFLLTFLGLINSEDVEKGFSWFLILFFPFLPSFLSFFEKTQMLLLSRCQTYMSIWEDEGSENRSGFVVFNQTPRHYNDSSYTNCHCYSTTANSYNHVNYVRGPLGSFGLSSLAMKDAFII